MTLLDKNINQFYQAKWANLLDWINYPLEIINHLHEEKRIFQSIVNDNFYLAVIEAGCADGQFFMPITLKLKLPYLGIDIVQNMIEHARSRIKLFQKSNINTAQVMCGDICNLPNIIKRYEIFQSNVVTVFPFNCFGNIANPVSAINAIVRCNYDILIFTYQINPISKKIRSEYYEGCCLTDIRCKEDEQGVLFESSDFFHSYAYHPKILVNWLQEAGYRVSKIVYGEIGLVFHGSLMVQ